MPEFNPDSTIREVVDSPDGQSLLYQHGYEVGKGFVDVLSQHQSLRDAARGGRLRDVEGLIAALNRT